MRRVLLTRPLEESEQSATNLRQFGFDVVIMPLSRLKTTFFHVEKPIDALIFTSFRAIAAIENLRALTHLPTFVVGERAAQALKTLGFGMVHAAEDGIELCALISASPHNIFLWASGTVSAVDIVAHCREKQIEREITYEMERVPQTIDCKALKIDYVLHYSKDNAQYFMETAKNIEYATHICLSKRVSSPIPATVLSSIATEPNEAGLFACLMRENTAI